MTDGALSPVLLLLIFTAAAIAFERSGYVAGLYVEPPARPSPPAAPPFVPGEAWPVEGSATFFERWQAGQARPANHAAAEEAVRASYWVAGLPAPAAVIWARSPREAVFLDLLLRRYLARRQADPGADPHEAIAWLADLALPQGTFVAEARHRLAEQLRSADHEWPGRGTPQPLAPAFTLPLGMPHLEVRDRRSGAGMTARGERAESLAHAIAAQLLIDTGHRWEQPLGPARIRDVFLAAVFDVRAWPEHARPTIEAHLRVARECFGWRPLEGAAILIESPIACRFDSLGRMHGEDGPAAVWADGWTVCAWHGERVDPAAIADPASLGLGGIRALPHGLRERAIEAYGRERYLADAAATPESIAAEPDTRLRRGLVDRYGPARWVAEIGVVIDHDLDRDGEARRLWRADRLGDDPLVMLEVANSTPEPDGSRHHYWLRVPPRMRTCPDAVAWTFGLMAREYQPTIET